MDPDQILKAVKPCLSAWDLQIQAITMAAQSENIVYHLISDDGKEYAVRVHRPGYHTLEELNSEHLWTSALHQAGVHVPGVCRTKTGEYYQPIFHKGIQLQVGVVEWLNGKLLKSVFEQEPGERYLKKQLGNLGRLAAQMHNQASNWMVPEGFVRHRLDADGLMGEDPLLGPFWILPELSPAQRKLFSDLRINIFKRLKDLGEDRDHFSMIHADLHRGNLMVTDNGLHAIDFDDACFGWHLYDLSLELFRYHDHADLLNLRAALINGYHEERSLSDDDVALFPLFALVRSLVYLGWLHARPELGRDEERAKLIVFVCEQAELLQGL